jgi:DNA polymerase-1
MKRPLYLVDSYAFIYRSYFAFLSRPLRNAAGANVSAVFGFFRFIFNLFDERNPGAFAAVFDSRGPTFRHEMFEAYKATRQKTPDDLHAQVPLVEEILGVLKVPLLRAEGFEADDVIATLAARCKAEDRECWIVSGDKDLLQLVGGPVKALRPDSSFAFRPYGVEEVKAEWGVEPERILDYLSLTGDASDNVPGVTGIGDKTALKLLTEYGSLDGIYGKLDSVKPDGVRNKLAAGRESAELSRRLITLRLDAPLTIKDLDELELDGIDRRAANPLFMREGMKSLVASAAQAGVGVGELFDGPAGASSAAAPGAGGTGAAGAAAAAAGLAAGRGAEGLPVRSPEAPPIPAALTGEGEYETVTEPERLAAWVDRCLAASAFAFDCETDSLDERRARPVGFSLSCEEKKACYVPLRAPEGDPAMPEAVARRELSRLFAAKKSLLIGQNVKYDYSVMGRWLGRYMENRLYDTMIASWLLDAEGDSFGLEALAERRLGYHGIDYDEVVPKGATFADVPLSKAARYAAEDADLTFRLYRLTEPELEAAKLASIFRDLEMPLVPILAAMEAEGIRVEAPELRAFGAELEVRLASLEREIWGLVGHEFNVASTKQLQEVLFVERKLPAGKRTKTGFSTDTSVLEELAALDPVPEKILARRSLAKLKSTYVDALVDLVETEAQGDLLDASTAAAPERRGRIHTHFVQTGTATGRLSSRDPNLQNIPVRDEEGRRIRQAFVAGKGNLLVSADYSQIELVVLAHLSDDEGLRRAFRDGVDVHRRTASLLFKVDEAAVTPEQRRIAKTINFGVIYGMSAFRLANELRIGRGEAQGFIDSYFATYSGVTDFIRKTVETTERTGYAETILGRRRPILMINSRNKTEKQAAERVAVNTPIQGSAADIVKLAMLRVDAALRKAHPSARLLLQVHDELIVEAPEKEAKAAGELMRKEMEAAIELSVPLRVSVESARAWGDMH